MIPLPSSYAERARTINTHPGLALDKFVDYSSVTSGQFDAVGEKFSGAVQRPTVEKLALMRSPFREGEFDELRQRRSTMLGALNAKVIRATTAGPFTLHLARASALENAGLSLHSIYGFAYLPASGLKGLARAYAVTIDGIKDTAPEFIEIFGGSAEDKSSCAGAIVFHDAWPTKWPKLVEDILNTHHKDYYSANEKNVPPPGDWEEPSMVSFLAVAKGTTYDFPLSCRRDDARAGLIETAQKWLLGGLTMLGAGAKTSAGYGHFVSEPEFAHLIPASEKNSYNLELVTPAFLAGANQKAIDCELRPATLRGLLRWWWRTLHSGFVDTATLRRMESVVWGNTQIGGAARFTLEEVSVPDPVPYDRKAIISLNKLPQPNARKTTQGLTYHSYGMDEIKEGVQVRRSYIPPAAKWKVRIQVRDSLYQSVTIPATQIESQAAAALWLLCRYGGVGAKNRKGFGGLAVPKGLQDFSLNKCKQLAAEFRKECGLNGATFNNSRAGSPSWEQAVSFEIPTGLVNSWLALDAVASSAQAFAQTYKHRLEKKALGLPRKIGTPVTGSFHPGNHVKKDRHASPVNYHLSKTNGGYTVEVIAFPAPELPDLGNSQKLLGELLQHLQADLPNRFKAAKLSDGDLKSPSKTVTVPAVAKGPALKAHDLVHAVIVKDPKDRGRVFARVETAPDFIGNVMNSDDMPAELRALDSKVQLKIANVNLTTKIIGFNYPKPKA